VEQARILLLLVQRKKLVAICARGSCHGSRSAARLANLESLVLRLSEARRLFDRCRTRPWRHGAIVLYDCLLNFLSKLDSCLALVTVHVARVFPAQQDLAEFSTCPRPLAALAKRAARALAQVTCIRFDVLFVEVGALLHAGLPPTLLHLLAHLLEEEGGLMEWLDAAVAHERLR